MVSLFLKLKGCLWDTTRWSVTVEYSTRQLVHLVVSWNNEVPWHVTAVYGSPHRAFRHSLWDDLWDISQNISGPWCAIGDFNAFLHVSEKEGGTSIKPSSPCRDFHNCLVVYGLEDMGFKGCPFTWHRGDLKERLDRAVINLQWRLRFQEASIFYLSHYKSDHVPLWLCFKQPVSRNRGKRPFRFLASWLTHNECKSLVKRSWNLEEDWNWKVSSFT